MLESVGASVLSFSLSVSLYHFKIMSIALFYISKRGEKTVTERAHAADICKWSRTVHQSISIEEMSISKYIHTKPPFLYSLQFS